MKAYLVRVGIDQTRESGNFNGPVNPQTAEFAYVPIRELRSEILTNPTYREFQEASCERGRNLPGWLTEERVHLDPDFKYLTYGGVDGRDLSSGKVHHREGPLRGLSEDDLLVFYAGLWPTKRPAAGQSPLTYAIIGLYVLKEKPISAAELIRRGLAHTNAHTRCEHNEYDIIFLAKPRVSGRLSKCIPIGRYRDRAYRVDRGILEEWGDLSVKDGYVQLSGTLPRFKDPDRFYAWFKRQLSERNIHLLQKNN